MTHNRDQGEADPWGAVVSVPEWDSMPGPDPAGVEDIRDQPVGAAGRPVGRRRRRPIELTRSHRLALALGVCFVVAALEMLSVRPDHQARSNRKAGTGRPSQAHPLGPKPR